MVKAKKKNLSEFAQQKRVEKNKKQLNPFEMHVNRHKQEVLGQKSKNDRGLPGISKAKAINKRKQSLLQEYKLKNKDNVFLDKRLGETNSNMITEDKAMARFARERIKEYKKKNVFNLNDDEVLTHRGQTLEEIEKFDDPKSDDEFSDDENISGKLDKNFVQSHFGGGVLSKSDSSVSRKDLINQLIIESKKRKAEKQKIREQTIDLTEKLDSEWKDLLPIMSISKKSMESEDIDEVIKIDAFDIAVRQLKFEVRGNPSEKLKSEEEIVQEEKAKLKALEADRLKRMKGFISDINNQYRHKSADDLNDNFIMEITTKDDDISDISNEEDNNVDNDKIDDDEDISDNKQKEIKLENIVKEIVEDMKLKPNDKNKESTCLQSSNTKHEFDINLNDRNSERKIDDSNTEESEDNLSDLKESESSSENESKSVEKCVRFSSNLTKGSKQTNQLVRTCPESILKQNNNNMHAQSLFDKNKQENRSDLLKQKEIIEKAREELPYTYNAPENFEELEKLLENHNADYQSVIIDRIIKCNHWTLDGKNKEKMSNLFKYLLEHINNCATTENANDLVQCLQIFDRLCPYFYDLAHMNPENAKTCIQEIIKRKHDEYEKNKRRYPGVDTLIFFKLVSLIFPTSDFRHHVVTPCLVFMSQILLRARIKRYRSDIAKGLFICTLILEYTILSKRLAPSVINFLRGIIYMATPTDLTQTMKIIPPFKTTCKALVIVNDVEIAIEPDGAHMFASDLIHEELDDIFRIKALLTAMSLVMEFKVQLQELEAVYSIFEPILNLLKINKFRNYPSNIRRYIKEQYKKLKLLRNKKLDYIVLEQRRPKPLRTYEPKIMTVYDGKQHKSISKEKAEREKLLHKYKKEFKGAVREIRRDRDFLAKVQIVQQIKSDTERKRKVNEIFGEAAMQQNEIKKLKKRK